MVAVGTSSQGGEGVPVKKNEVNAQSRKKTAALCKRYLALPADQRAALENRLKAYSGSIQPVIEALKPPTCRETRSGEIIKEHFTAPGLLKRYPEELLYFFVPESYDAAKPFGLLIFMHGGDKSTPREKAGVIVSSPDNDPGSYGLRPRIEKASLITVAPSAPRKGGGGKRWNVPEADGYIAAVIEECQYRFNIELHRVLLGGHSMGAFGAYHLCQRLNDRIAGGLLSAGSWNASDFRCLTGTGVFLIHGKNDTAPGASPVKGQLTRQAQWTGVAFARAAVELMKRDHIPHDYHEHGGGHAFKDGDEGLAEFIRLSESWRRSPFPKRVVAVSPRGSGHIKPTTATPHTYWLSINKLARGKIAYDSILLSGPNVAKNADDLQKQGYTLGRTRRAGGRIEAALRGENSFELKTENVLSFSLWLHPEMIDFSRPVSVIVNGKRREFAVKASLLDAIRSYERKGDWGLIYHAELVIEVP
jgi:poly(3-hydroxybutyrate) depolymerase